MSRSFEEIKARCFCILDNEKILFLVKKSSSPSVAFKMIMTKTNNIEEAKAGRWLVVMRRDHGSKYLNLTQNKLSHVSNNTVKKEKEMFDTIETNIMSPERLKSSLDVPDLSDPKNGVHVINIIVEKVEDALKKVYSDFLFEEVRTDPRVTIKENFDDLLFPADNIGRSSRYTRYVTEDIVLRTHTSASIPGWLKKNADNGINNAIAVLPGICYRRDVVDKTHCGEPHQMDVWIIKNNEPKFGRKDLIQLIETILNSAVPGFEYRANEVQHPYTLNGLEVEILVSGEWLELLECGEAHPTVLKNSGLNPEKFSGLALGMGLDRLIMLIKKIDDIRILRSQDPRIKSQMKNLDPYVVVSKYPPIRQDLSVSVTKNTTQEDICEKISDAMGDNSNVIEEIVIVSETPYEKLPDKAIKRLGIEPGQKNMLVKVVLRSHERSLIHEEANNMRDIIYRAIDESKTGGYLTYRE